MAYHSRVLVSRRDAVVGDGIPMGGIARYEVIAPEGANDTDVIEIHVVVVNPGVAGRPDTRASVAVDRVAVHPAAGDPDPDAVSQISVAGAILDRTAIPRRDPIALVTDGHTEVNAAAIPNIDSALPVRRGGALVDGADDSLNDDAVRGVVGCHTVADSVPVTLEFESDGITARIGVLDQASFESADAFTLVAFNHASSNRTRAPDLQAG